jgi:adenosine kinase
VNLSNISVVNKHRAAILGLLPFADVVFAKDKEAVALAQASSPEEAAIRLSRSGEPHQGADASGVKVMVVTRGTQPTIVACQGRVSSITCLFHIVLPSADRVSQLATFDVPVVPREKIVDLIGSGDAFVGGFLAEFVRSREGTDAAGRRPEADGDRTARCVMSGHMASSEIIQHPGCTFSPTPPAHDRTASARPLDVL